MAELVSPVTVLADDRAWDILSAQQIGRIAIAADPAPDVFPVNYVVDGESIVFRTAEGSKLSGLLAHGQVSFEVDTWDVDHGYSVLAQGRAAPVTDPLEVALVEALRLQPWVPTCKTVFVRIDVTAISARRFDFGPDPIRKYRY
ncbi:MAG: pyridoxamine 5'-phosphate oxidase family protein [Propionibacteriaceae bacterium]|jgi:nitroimidazol reductase NimA-like FMN-containing flavoprotein (pyridoxamine 5'-phosphate oxidase superfamily)|nr:pyridoxamine 5'-phosphate oxidase family protein [Propionibacteriaceae bacterium]